MPEPDVAPPAPCPLAPGRSYRGRRVLRIVPPPGGGDGDGWRTIVEYDGPYGAGSTNLANFVMRFGIEADGEGEG
jgi:hypothetical protein